MRTIYFLLFFGFLISCKKDNQIKLLQKDIVGIWEFEKSIGYCYQPTLPAGNGGIIIIGEDGSFERKQHDTLIFRGNYLVQERKDCYERETDLIFSTNENFSDNYQYVKIVEGKLTFSTPNCYQDGGTVYYRRLTHL